MELEHEDTLTILERYIDEMNTNIDSKKIKEIMKSLYVEALEVVLHHHNAVVVEAVEKVIDNPLNYDIVVDILHYALVVDWVVDIV
jgi:hypothetical protein